MNYSLVFLAFTPLVFFPSQQGDNRDCLTLDAGGSVRMLIFLDDTRIAALVDGAIVQEWTVEGEQWKKKNLFKSKTMLVSGPVYRKEAKTVLMADITGGYLQEVKDGELKKKHGEPKPLETSFMAASPTGKRAGVAQRLFSEAKWHIHVIDLENLQEVSNLYGVNGRIECLAFSNDDKMLASLGEDIVMWDLKTGKELRRTNKVRSGKGPGGCVAFSPKGNLLGFSYNETRLLSTEDFKTVMKMPAPDAGGVLAFSPDGKLLALGGNFQNEFITTLWDISNPDDVKKVKSFKGHTKFVQTLQFSPKGDKLVSGSLDGTIKIWEVVKEGGNGKEKCR